MRLPDAVGEWDLLGEGGVVREVRRSPGDRGREAVLALPGFADIHLHADRTYQVPPRRAESFAEAVEMALALARADRAGVADRAERLFRRASAHGTVLARTHVNVDATAGLDLLRGVLEGRRRVRDALAVEVVAYASRAGDPSTPGAVARLEAALDEGAELLGGPASLWEDPPASTARLLELAARRDARVDLHVDEASTARRARLPEVVELVRRSGLSGRVALSHCCSLPYLPAALRRRVIDGLLEAGATVNVQPALNLYLQDSRRGATPRRRGVTLVKELLSAGVPVRFGSDNVQDAFFPYGDADPLETAFLAALAAGVRDDAALLAGVAGGRASIGAGDPADLVLLRAESLADAIARRPPERTVLRGGAMVADDLGVQFLDVGVVPGRGDEGGNRGAVPRTHAHASSPDAG